MSNPVDGETVWQAFAAGGYLEELYPDGRQAIKPFIVAIPQALSGLLDKALTLKNFGLATLAIGTHCLENDLYGKMFHTDPPPTGVTAEQAKAIIARNTERLAAHLDHIALGSPKLADADDAECVAVVSDMLNPENLKRYRSGTLTIGDVLASQPTLFCAAIRYFLTGLIGQNNEKYDKEEEDDDNDESDEYECELEDDEGDYDDGDGGDDFDDDGGGKPPRGN